MRSMQWQLGILGTISAFDFRHRETKKKHQCTHSTTNTHAMITIHTRQLQQYTRPTNNNYTCIQTFSKFDRHFPFLDKAGHKWWALCMQTCLHFCRHLESNSLSIQRSEECCKQICGKKCNILFCRVSQGIYEQFPGDPWIHFSNAYFEVYLFFYYRDNLFLK